MIVERVFLGDAQAVELRGPCGEICALLYLVVCAATDKQNVPLVPCETRDFCAFTEECFRIIDERFDIHNRWLFFCTDVECFTESSAVFFRTKLDDKAKSENCARAELLQEIGLVACQRCWMIDRQTRRFFCVQFDFSPPIFDTTLLAGKMMRHSVYRPTGNAEFQQPAEQTREQSSTKQKMLQRLRQMLSNDERVPELAVQQARVTHFMICDVASWCGDMLNCAKTEWLAQQLNVWFHSDSDSDNDSWFRPNSVSDVCTFRVALLDSEFTSQDTLHDLSKLMPLSLSVASTLNATQRYPKSACGVCFVPDRGHVCIGHFLPLFDANGENWSKTHKLVDVRMFRVYKTQYPFIYTLMPDDEKRVQELKSKLKTSNEANPSVCNQKIAAKVATQEDKTTPPVKYTPLVLTLPTAQCDRFVRAVFRETPKFQYRLFYCARYDTDTQTVWIPICPA